MERDVSKNFILWAELVDLGVESALAMLRKRDCSYNEQMILLKKVLEEQSQSHYKINIRTLKKLNNVK
jgi:hypothetical protein